MYVNYSYFDYLQGPRGVTSQQVVDITTNLIKTPSHFGIITNDSDAVRWLDAYNNSFL